MRLLALAPLALATACAAARDVPRAPPALDGAALEARCARGFPVECRTLGRARLLGDGLPEDGRLGSALLVAACEMGEPGACGDVAVLHATGRSLPQADGVAAALSRRACAEGAALACSNQGVLVAAGVAAADARGEGSAAGRAARLFRTACDAGAPEGCLNVGAAQEHGYGLPRDARAAALAYRRACETGLGLGCHRLAQLLGERPDLAPDLVGAALELRACGAGIAPACAQANERAPDLGPRAPSPRLVEDRASFALGIPGAGGFHPGELAAVPPVAFRRGLGEARRPPRGVQESVPPGLRERLGVDGPPRPGDAADPPVDLLVALRREQLGRCYEAPRPAARVDVLVAFLVGPDGHPEAVRAAGDPEDEGLEACAREVVEGWEFPAAPEGHSGPHLARYAFEAAPPGPAPALAGAGWLRPAPRDPSCLARSLEVPPAYRGAAGSATVKLAVGAEGAPALLHALTPTPEPILAAIRAAVRRCAWSPGADPDGRPAAAWVTLTVNLAGR